MNLFCILLQCVFIVRAVVLPAQQHPFLGDSVASEQVTDEADAHNITIQAYLDPGNLGVCPHSQQWSGYVTNIQRGNLFFWMFMSRDRDPRNAPVVLWLNGGPGCSSLYGAIAQWGSSRINGAPPAALVDYPHTLISDVSA